MSSAGGSGVGFLGGMEAAIQIFDQVGNGFQPRGQADRAFRNAGRQQGLRGHAEVGVVLAG